MLYPSCNRRIAFQIFIKCLARDKTRPPAPPLPPLYDPLRGAAMPEPQAPLHAQLLSRSTRKLAAEGGQQKTCVAADSH